MICGIKLLSLPLFSGGPYLGKVALRSNSTEPSPDPVYLDNAPCKPRPEAVEVPQPEDKNALHFPLFVTLHRCRGACSERPFETRCEARGMHIQPFAFLI